MTESERERKKTKWRSGLVRRRGVIMEEEEEWEVEGRSWKCLELSLQLGWRSNC